MLPVLALCLGACALLRWGTLTTCSSFSAEVVAMLQQSRYALALGTAALHLFGSLLLTVVGIKSVALVMAR